jgi:hypothetical protein
MKIILLAALFFVNQNVFSQEIGRADLAKFVGKLSSVNACTVESVLDKVDSELFIKLLGNVLTADGIPKTLSATQNEFYYLALQSNDIPSKKDKETLLKVLFHDNCFTPDFQYDHPLLRQVVVEGVQGRLTVRRELLEDKISYSSIVQKLNRLSNSQEFLALMTESLDKNPDLLNEFISSLSRISKRIELITGKYNIQLK